MRSRRVGLNGLGHHGVDDLVGHVRRRFGGCGGSGRQLAMVLTKDYLAIGAVSGARGTNLTLQAPTQPVPVMIGMTALHLLEQAIGRRPGCASIIGRTSPFHNPSNGSGPGRLRMASGYGAKCRFVSRWRAVGSLNPALAAATCYG